MPGIGLELDPVAEDAANVPLNINDGTKFRAMSFQHPTPERDTNWASSADTEGALPANLRYQNRTLTIECRVYGSSAANLMEELGKLEQKVGRVNTPGESATLKWTGASGTSCIFDLLEGAADFQIDNTALATNRAIVTITLIAKPFWRSGTEVEGSLHEETTLPFIIGVDTGLGGDVPPLGRLVITEKQAQDQWSLIWGTQSRSYSSSANAELFYQAESRTALGSSEVKAGPEGGSGAGSNTIFNNSLVPNYQAIMSTQAASAGAHLSHIGTYRVFARIQRPTTNTGEVSVALAWARGDFLRSTQNAAKTYKADELEGVWTLADLGLVRIQKVTSGTQRWEGRVNVKSTVAGDDIYVDCLAFFPVDEGYGELKTTLSSSAPATLSAHDEFDQTAGSLGGSRTEGITAISAANPGVITIAAHGLANGDKVWIEGIVGTASVYNGVRTVANVLTNSFTAGVDTTGKAWTSGGRAYKVGKTAAQGGGWYGTGDAGDFSVNPTNHSAERTEVNDADLNTGRYVFPAEGEYTTLQVAVDLTASVRVAGATQRFGVIARYSSVENWLAAIFTTDSNSSTLGLSVVKRVAGTISTLAIAKNVVGGTLANGATVALNVLANGAWTAYAYPPGVPNAPLLEGQDAALAAGGALEKGRAGILDAWTSATANTRTYDNFLTFSTSTSDAAVFASKKAEVRWDRYQREDSSGTLNVPRSDYKGSYFRPPPARREARSNRTIVKLSRYNTDTMADAAIDDAAFRIFWQARGLVLPES